MDNDKTLTSDKAMRLESPAGDSPGALAKGTILAGRFTVEALAGRGGMGSVYRATDTRTGRPVALKLMHAAISPEVAYRFKREAVLLSGLRHPHIVSYVAHGSAAEGQPYLAMEWLEGEDLARRLAREPLSLSETLALLRRVAEALATSHQQDIVHRDIKPSNLFLRAGRPEDVVVLDFGLARHAIPSLVGVTGTGMVLGTPGYMAPEQASSQPEISPAADIFSLGCVLYECLTGQPPFNAPHFAAVLAKILFAEPVPLHTRKAGLPQGLQVLVDRMLAKDVKRRLPDATRLLESLSALEPVPELLLTPSQVEARPLSLAHAEQQLVSVLLVSTHARNHAEQGTQAEQGLALRDTLREGLAPYGGQVELLADGSLVATLLPDRGSATDQAMLAARCALGFKERWPEALVVLVTGLGSFSERLPVGEVMDRAGRLLQEMERSPTASVVLDEVTAGLLGPGFQLSRALSGAFALHGEQLSADASRPLLGMPTPCVGREQELAMLEFSFNACAEEPAARAVLVMAQAGMGKSRLRHEFLRRIERREHPALVLLGRADPMSAGASYGLLGQALRRLCGVVEGEGLEARRDRLFRRVSLHVPATKLQETVEFLGELCAIHFPEEGSPRLRAARGDPRLMSAQMCRALGTFLGAECAHQPVLLVLEDLHWSDALTLKLVDDMLRELAEHPFMVLALARPEVKGLFPNLWALRVQEFPLGGLSRKASSRLVREVLGPQVPESVIRRAVEQSDGNALFLEELIRMVAEGRGEAPPETVLAVLQARLMRMEPGVRQVLLAASIFGRTFWADGVGALLGWQSEHEVLRKHLRQLVEQEVIEALPDSRFPAVEEYRFRHALVRDAAYGLVPDSHRPINHRLAGMWLDQMGESDALTLASHYRQGAQLERAALLYTRAADQLFERHDIKGLVQCIDAALVCGVSDEVLPRLRALQAMAAFWMFDLPKTLEQGIPSVARLKAGSPLWCRLIGGLLFASMDASSEQQEQLVSLSEVLLRTTPEPEALTAYLEAVAHLGLAVICAGDRQQVELLLRRSMDVGRDALAHDGMVRGWLCYLKHYFLHLFEASPWQAFLVAKQGEQDFGELGSEHNASAMNVYSGMTLAGLGDAPHSVALLKEALVNAQSTGLHLVEAAARLFLIVAQATSPEPEHWQEARALASQWEASARFNFIKGVSYAALAQVMAKSGELRAAEAQALQASELLAPFRSHLVFARTVLSSILLAQGRVEEARRTAEFGVRDLEQMRSQGVYAVGSYLALAEACFAYEDAGSGEAALRKALQCVRARASDIPEFAARERFLRQVPENARTLALAHQRWGEAVA